MKQETPLWKSPDISLGERCVELALHEMQRGVRANPYGQPNTSNDVRVYLAGCLRNLDEDPELENLGLTEGNWCAAFVSWCLEQCLLPGEERPHHYRAGVVEIIADAQARKLWHPVEEVRSGAWTPSRGDLVIWDRSEAGKPSTAWWRHVNRLMRFDGENLLTVGGNEHRTIVVTSDAPKKLDDSKLIGFVSYAQAPPATIELTTKERAEQLKLVAMFVENHRKGLS